MTFSGYDISIIKDIRDYIKEDNILWFKLLLEKYLNLINKDIVIKIITPINDEELSSESNKVYFYFPIDYCEEEKRVELDRLLDKIYNIIIYLEQLNSLNYIKFREKSNDKKTINVFGKKVISATTSNNIEFIDHSKIINELYIYDDNLNATHTNINIRPSIALDIVIWCNRILYIKPELNILIDNNLKTEEEIIFERELEQRESQHKSTIEKMNDDIKVREKLHNEKLDMMEKDSKDRDKQFKTQKRLTWAAIIASILTSIITTGLSIYFEYFKSDPTKLDKDQFQRIEKILEKK